MGAAVAGRDHRGRRAVSVKSRRLVDGVVGESVGAAVAGRDHRGRRAVSVKSRRLEGALETAGFASEHIPGTEFRVLGRHIVDAGEVLVDLGIAGRAVTVQQGESPNRLLDEEQQRVPQPWVPAPVGPPPQRGERMRGAGQEQVVHVREAFRREPRAVVHRVDGKGVGGDLRRQRESGDAVEHLEVGGVGFLLPARAGRGVVDQHGPQADALPRPARRGVGQGLERPYEVVLLERYPAVRARERGPRAAGVPVERLVEEHDLARAVGAREHLAPYGVVDAAGAAPVGVARLVHPADLGLDLGQESVGRGVERADIERDVVVGGDEGGGRRQVAEDHAAGAPRRRLAFLRLPALLQRAAVGGRRGAAPLGGDAGHARAAEAVEDHVAGLRVVEDGRDDRQVRHLGVVAVRPVEGVGLADADVDGERLAVVRLVGVVRPALALDELGQERVGARGVVRRVGQPQDVLVFGHGEVRSPPQLGELLLQQREEVLAARLVRVEGQPEALDLRGVLGCDGLPEQPGVGITRRGHVRPPGPCECGRPGARGRLPSARIFGRAPADSRGSSSSRCRPESADRDAAS